MATYKDLNTSLTLRWVDVEDVSATQRALIEVTPAGASLELPRGEKGDPGKTGAPGPQVWWTRLITDPAQLPDDLAGVDRGCAWVDTNSKSMWIWDRSDFFEVPDFVGLRGEQGETGETGTVQVGTVNTGEVASASVNTAASTDSVTVLDFTLAPGPRGMPGDKGDPGDMGPLGSADDVDLTVPPTSGDALRWNGSVWVPRQSTAPVGPFALSASDFPVAEMWGSHRVVVCDWKSRVRGISLARSRSGNPEVSRAATHQPS